MGDVEQAGADPQPAGCAPRLSRRRAQRVAASARSRSKRLSVSRSPRFKSQILATRSAVDSRRQPGDRLSIQDAALAVARESGREASIAEALAQRASLLAALNRTSEAAASDRVKRANISPACPDPAFRSRVEVAVLATESDLKRRADPAAAADAATQAIQIVQQRRDRLRLAQLNLRLAQANHRVGTDRAGARRARARASRRSTRSARRARNSGRFRRSTNRGSCSMPRSSLSLKEKDYERAFALAEAARARSASEAKKFGAVEPRRGPGGLAPG